mmetsp:Transcript_15913/g.36514  ORF Transcript_15913/g.36514 Transcript_15913/m.36514 type:complete len:226 (+) Transcript_15913:661-1338(+)
MFFLSTDVDVDFVTLSVDAFDDFLDLIVLRFFDIFSGESLVFANSFLRSASSDCFFFSCHSRSWLRREDRRGGVDNSSPTASSFVEVDTDSVIFTSSIVLVASSSSYRCCALDDGLWSDASYRGDHAPVDSVPSNALEVIVSISDRYNPESDPLQLSLAGDLGLDLNEIALENDIELARLMSSPLEGNGMIKLLPDDLGCVAGNIDVAVLWLLVLDFEAPVGNLT